MAFWQTEFCIRKVSAFLKLFSYFLLRFASVHRIKNFSKENFNYVRQHSSGVDVNSKYVRTRMNVKKDQKMILHAEIDPYKKIRE